MEKGCNHIPLAILKHIVKMNMPPIQQHRIQGNRTGHRMHSQFAGHFNIGCQFTGEQVCFTTDNGTALHLKIQGRRKTCSSCLNIKSD